MDHPQPYSRLIELDLLTSSDGWFGGTWLSSSRTQITCGLLLCKCCLVMLVGLGWLFARASHGHCPLGTLVYLPPPGRFAGPGLVALWLQDRLLECCISRLVGGSPFTGAINIHTRKTKRVSTRRRCHMGGSRLWGGPVGLPKGGDRGPPRFVCLALCATTMFM
jgi:hypothetical protein